MCKMYDELPLVARIVLQVFAGVVIGGVYRLLKFLESKNPITLVAAIVFLFTGVGNFVCYVVDLYTTVRYKKITYLAD